jgi:hypothetical protein
MMFYEDSHNSIRKKILVGISRRFHVGDDVYEGYLNLLSSLSMVVYRSNPPLAIVRSSSASLEPEDPRHRPLGLCHHRFPNISKKLSNLLPSGRAGERN